MSIPLYRRDLQALARRRLRESRVLLNQRFYDGAYHIAGFSLECALKACIAKNIARHEFPDKSLVKDLFVHELDKLVKKAGLSSALQAARADANFDANWAIVTQWTPDVRYSVAITRHDARGFIPQ